jgi:hydroxymethylpyrimidine/phosphomethylpyrimidine kinase
LLFIKQSLNTTLMHGRVLTIAGSDSGGGAGIQADIKTITVLGGYAMTAITALTAQNTLGVHGVYPVPPEFVAQQIKVVLDDIGADAVKIGMLHTAEVIEAVAQALKPFPTIPLVLDPVMVAKGGARLLEDSAVNALLIHLVPRAMVVTPNIPEAEALGGVQALLAAGAGAVLLKGGHDEGETVIDRLLTNIGEIERFTAPRQHTRHTHGTGCTYAAAITAGLAQGMPLGEAIAWAFSYLQQAIATAPGFGKGQGSVNHAVVCS